MAEHQEPLFDLADFPAPPPVDDKAVIRPLTHPLWTEHKAALIHRYLYYFIQITKHGTYIDGFAGPQNNHLDMWAAKKVVELAPAWLRRFHLVELDPKKKPLLEGLREWEVAQARKPKRSVQIYPGDFNVAIDGILGAKTISDKEATFCLLDQRTFECHWASVQKVAAYKPAGSHKIEIFYFLAMGWLDRALKATLHTDTLDRWFGGDGWRALGTIKKPFDRAQLFAQRFRDELGYTYSDAWPIYKRRGSGTIMYYMVHASDHPEARKLMRRAYSCAVDPLEPPEQLALEGIRVKK
jgi:three-Cys-motif partner protein